MATYHFPPRKVHLPFPSSSLDAPSSASACASREDREASRKQKPLSERSLPSLPRCPGCQLLPNPLPAPTLQCLWLLQCPWPPAGQDILAAGCPRPRDVLPALRCTCWSGHSQHQSMNLFCHTIWSLIVHKDRCFLWILEIKSLRAGSHKKLWKQAVCMCFCRNVMYQKPKTGEICKRSLCSLWTTAKVT